MKSLLQWCAEIKETLNHERAEFRATFHDDLADYWHPISGFDIVAFDEKLIKSGTQSVASMVAKKYGDKAVAQIKRLLPLPTTEIVQHCRDCGAHRFKPSGHCDGDCAYHRECME